MDFRPLQEVDTWKLIVEGNDEAFAYIYNAYSSDMFKYGHKFTQDADLIEDVIQDVYVTVWEKRECISIQHSIKYYLFSCFRRDLIKKINLAYQSESLEEFHAHMDWEASFMEILEENQITLKSQSTVSKALECLPARQKEAIYLKYLQELSYEEISELMGIQIPSLYNLIFKGIKSLKAYLSPS